MHPPSSNPTPRIANFHDPDVQDADCPNADFHEAIINPSPSRHHFSFRTQRIEEPYA
jgi:hypothetical protein